MFENNEQMEPESKTTNNRLNSGWKPRATHILEAATMVSIHGGEGLDTDTETETETDTDIILTVYYLQRHNVWCYCVVLLICL